MFCESLYLKFTFQQSTGINVALYQLAYQNQILKSDESLQQVNIVDGSQLILQGKI